jgi:hypothetical protein
VVQRLSTMAFEGIEAGAVSTTARDSSFDKSRTIAKLQSVIDFGELQHHSKLGKIDRRVEALDDAVFPSAIVAAEIQMRIWHLRIDEQDVIHWRQ